MENKKKVSSLFLERYHSFAEELPNISNAWADAKTSANAEIYEIPYENKLGSNQSAVSAIKNVLQDKGKKTLICAETGSGKTWALLNTVKEYTKEVLQAQNVLNKNNLIPVTIYLVPNRIQVKQCSRQYGIRGIVAGDNISYLELQKENGFIMVYDKVNEILDYLKNGLLNERFQINLIIDEAHLLFQAEHYRPVCIRRIFETINEVEKICGNIIFVTASFATLAPLPFDRTLVFYRHNEIPKPDTTIVLKPEGIRNIDFILNEIAKGLKEKRSVYVRMNDKTLAHRIAEDLLKKGIARDFAFLNSDEKEECMGIYANPTLGKLIETNDLEKKGVWFCTSMVDAGVNIDTVGGIEDENLCVLFVCDTQNIQTDNIEQSFNRFRFFYKERKILLCNIKEGYKPLSLPTVLKYNYRNLLQEMDAYQSIFNIFINNYGKEKAAELITKQLNYICQDGSTSAGCLYLQEICFNGDKTYQLEYDRISFFRYCREQIYMRQFLNPNLLREELEKILGGSIYIETSCNNVELSLDSKTDTERKIYFEQILMNNEKIQLFDTQIGPDWNKYKNSYIGNIYLILKRKYSAKESIQFLATLSYKKLKQLTKDICKQEIAELGTKEKKALLSIVKGEPCHHLYNVETVENVLNGEYKKFLTTLIKIGCTGDKPFKIIRESESDSDIKEQILQMQTKAVNAQYLKNYRPSGQFEKEQFALIKAIETHRKGTSITLKSDGAIMESILTQMNENKGLKNTYTAGIIMEMAMRIYRGRKIEGGYLLWDLDTYKEKAD